MELGKRFRVMYRNLGMDLPACAKFLHITERTLHNWELGKHDIPYSAYRLLRLLNRMEMPGKSWEGWCFHGGKLWSPEGHSFVGTDSSWWSLLIRQARQFPVLLARNAQLESKLARAGTAADGKRSAAAAVPARAANQPTFEFSPMVITGRYYGVSHYEIGKVIG